MEYILHILIFVSLYAIVGISLNLVAGYTGLMSLSHAGFYGIGAYAAALVSLNFGANLLLGMAIAAVVSSLFGFVIAWPALRVRDDFFVVTTFGFQVILFQIMNNWMELTNGPIGLPGIPQPVLFGFKLATRWDFVVLSVLTTAFVFLIAKRLTTAPFGTVLRAIREDEQCALSFGKNVNVYKLEVFVLSAGLSALSGAIYAHYITFVDPTSFTISESIFMLSIVIVGGAGRLSGSIIGAALLVSIPEALRFLDLPSSTAGHLRQILYGAMLVAFIMFRPQGIWGEFSFRNE
jgi:branched-chain amino acid transport system permease protein